MFVPEKIISGIKSNKKTVIIGQAERLCYGCGGLFLLPTIKSHQKVTKFNFVCINFIRIQQME
jgi:hypothetical protein